MPVERAQRAESWPGDPQPEHMAWIDGGYCRRYWSVARHAEAIDPSTSHLEFRCVVREIQ